MTMTTMMLRVVQLKPKMMMMHGQAGSTLTMRT
jgi:hypothetical protein